MDFYICAIIKDSHWYLDEWINHHLSIGVKRIFLIEDIGSLSHNDITGRYPQVELHRYEDLVRTPFERGVDRQKETYRWFYNTHKEGWCAFIDDDEFLELKDGNTLDTVMEAYKDCPAVVLPWEVYGSSGHIERCQFLTGSYTPVTDMGRHGIWTYKTMVNLSFEQELVNVHYFKRSVFQDMDTGTDALNHDLHTAQTILSRDNRMIIHHYFTKSWQDWLRKIKKRGDVIVDLHNIIEFFIENPHMCAFHNQLMRNTDYDTIDFHALQAEYDEMVKKKSVD